MPSSPPPPPITTTLALTMLGEQLAPLRLRSPGELRAMASSLARHGQLTAVACSRQGERVELVDGFKRMASARELGWDSLRVDIHEVAGPAAKLLLWQRNTRQELSPLEEAWVIRALYRDDRLTQPQIAQLLGRDKSWVCRRLLLAEGLHEEVEADVRLGLISATIAREVGRLPRGNQAAAAQVIGRRGLTSRQAQRLVDQLVAATDERTRTAILTAAATAPALAATDGAASAARRTVATPADLMLADAHGLAWRAGRLHGELHRCPLESLGSAALVEVVRARLGELHRVLAPLAETLRQVTAPPTGSTRREVDDVA